MLKGENKKMSKLLEQLNEKQKKAVLQTEGPVLVLAGAGSGKTRALTFRVAFLVRERKVPPKNILAVTFTNKAAGEMLERVKKLLGLPDTTPPYSQYLPNIGTFHAICVRILRREIEKLGYKKNFVIYDDASQKATVKRVMKELEISTEQMKPPAVLGTISAAKGKLIGPEAFEEQAGSYYEETVAKCYVAYQRELKIADALDFDDLIRLTVKLFQQFPDVLENYQKLFRYIMVDEYQDTNHAQYVLLKMLAEQHKNIWVCGDDFQSVYMWRGADIQNILNFEKDYPKAKVVLLEQNYRSTKNILDAAHSVIEKNINQKKKKLWTENSKGELLGVHQATNEIDEAEFIVQQIKKSKDERKMRFEDFAILYRTNAQSRALEEAFLKEGMAYRIIGGTRFYERKEIKDILAYVNFMVNPNDKVSFERIVNVPARGMGKVTVGKILHESDKFDGDVLKTIERLDAQSKSGEALQLQVAKEKVLKNFAKMIRGWQKFSKKNPPSKLIEKIYSESGYKQMLHKLGDEGEIRDENVMELLTVTGKFDALASLDNQEKGQQIVDFEDALNNFLEEVALVSQTDRDLEKTDAVPLMTMHAAKGLEYDFIFLVGMEEGLFPHSRASLSESEMEEERRLCYVGITRAKQKAHLIYTQTRTIYGSTQVSVRSRFVDEIDNSLFEESYAKEPDDFDDFNDDFDESPFRQKKKGFIRRTADIQLSELDVLDNQEKLSKETKFRDGDKVRHSEFGQGIVVSQTKDTVSVAFAGVGLKKLAKGVAPLEKI